MPAASVAPGRGQHRDQLPCLCLPMPCGLQHRSTFPRDRAGPGPALLSWLPQGLWLCQHRRPHCADDLPVPLHHAEKVTRGYVGRWGDRPAFGGAEHQAGQSRHRAFLWQEEPYERSPMGGALSLACLYFLGGGPSLCSAPQNSHPQVPGSPHAMRHSTEPCWRQAQGAFCGLLDARMAIRVRTQVKSQVSAVG